MATTRRTFAAAAGLLALGSVAGCSVDALRDWPPVGAPGLGMPVTAGDWQVTVLEARRTKTMQAGFMTATAKGEFVVVGLELVNRGRENGGRVPRDFALVDKGGVRYWPDTAASWAWSQGIPGQKYGAVGADSAQLPPGVPGRYVVTFDVAPAAQGLHLELWDGPAYVALGT